MYINVCLPIKFYLELELWLKISKMPSEKQLITIGKMPAARKVKMSIFGLWQLNSWTVNATTNLLANLLQQKSLLQPKSLLAKRQVNLLLKKLRNKFLALDFQQKVPLCKGTFFISFEPQTPIPSRLCHLHFAASDNRIFALLTRRRPGIGGRIFPDAKSVPKDVNSNPFYQPRRRLSKRQIHLGNPDETIQFWTTNQGCRNKLKHQQQLLNYF